MANRTSIALALLCIWFVSATNTHAKPKAKATPLPENECELVASAIRFASNIRGLKPKAKVECKAQDRAQVEKSLRKIIKERLPAKKLDSEGKLYKLLGVIPHDYDYEEGIVALYREQVAGYYDPVKNFYVMVKGAPKGQQLLIAVHELTHALQDQHFDLDKLIHRPDFPTDVALARSALAEGDAMAVTLDHPRQMQGLPPVTSEKTLSAFMLQTVALMYLTPTMGSAPQSMKTMLVFPYVSGLRFVHTIMQRDGNGYRASDGLFRNPPTSTSEVLHPERFGKEAKLPEKVTPPMEMRMPGEEELAVDRLGEFFISTLLNNFLPPVDASAAADGWKDDVLTFYRLKNGILHARWRINWIDGKEATIFFEALKKAYERRFSTPATGGSGTFSFRVQIPGSGALIVEAVKDESLVNLDYRLDPSVSG